MNIENKIISENVDNFLNIESYNKNMDKFLEEKKKHMSKETWSKLDKTTKIKKLNQYVDEIYSKEKNLTDDLIILCKKFLYDMLEKKKFIKNKDINYDKDTNLINNIPCLNYNSVNKTFFLTTDRKVNTLKSLPVMKKKKNKKAKTENDKEEKSN